MQDLPNALALLGLTKDTNIAEVKRAFRTKAFLVHPDRNKRQNATEMFIKLQQAYAFVLDDLLRKGKISISEAASSIEVDFKGLAELIILLTDNRTVNSAALYKSRSIKGFPFLDEILLKLSGNHFLEVLLSAENTRVAALYLSRTLDVIPASAGEDYKETFRFLVENIAFTVQYRLKYSRLQNRSSCQGKDKTRYSHCQSKHANKSAHNLRNANKKGSHEARKENNLPEWLLPLSVACGILFIVIARMIQSK